MVMVTGEREDGTGTATTAGSGSYWQKSAPCSDTGATDAVAVQRRALDWQTSRVRAGQLCAAGTRIPPRPLAVMEGVVTVTRGIGTEASA